MTAQLITAMALGGVGTALGVRLLADPQWLGWIRSLRTRVMAQWKVRGYEERLRDALRALTHRMAEVLDVAGRRESERVARIRERRIRAQEQALCLDELPELIDVVALGLSAGTSFDAALDMYCARYRTLLSRLLSECMQSWRLGLVDRPEALGRLANRLEVGAFSTFVETVTESLAFGAPLAQSLAEQAESIRQQRRYAVQERIEKAPVKMLVPTGTLILPAMLLAILGPLLASLTATAG